MDDRLAEQTLGALWECMEFVPAAARVDLGITVQRVGSGLVVSTIDDPSGYWSKAIGFTEPMTRDLVAEIVQFYRAQSSPGTSLLLAPWTLPADWPDICAEHGLTAGGKWTKFACPVDAIAAANTELRVGPVEPDQVPEWNALVPKLFGMTGTLAPLIAGYTNSPDFHPFAAWDGDTMAGTAGLYIYGDIGHFSMDATVPEYRNRGVHSALISARAQAAAAAGCKWLVVETAAGPGGTSLNNMIKAGFKPLYDPQNWRWRPSPSETDR